MSNFDEFFGDPFKKIVIKDVGPLSYTEDNCLINTIYISPTTKEEKELIKKNFSKFGDIQNVVITNRNSKNQLMENRHALIYYKQAESASKALKSRKFIYGYTNLGSAYSWMQPDRICLSQIKEEPIYDLNELNSKCPILDLNDDCLFKIFENLNNNDQIVLSTTCLRFENIFKLLHSKKHITIDLRQSFRLTSFPKYLETMGEHFESMSIFNGLYTKNLSCFMDSVSKFCINLSLLQIDTLNFKFEKDFHKCFFKLHMIKHLELINCSLDDEIMKSLSKLSKIDYLDLTENDQITGIHLANFQNLKTLILKSCKSIQSLHFIQMCSKTTQLKVLNIRHCDSLDNSAIEALQSNLKELQTLTICSCLKVDYTIYAEIESLKNLTIYSLYKINNLLSKLSDNKRDQIEILKITNFCIDASTIQTILSFSNLKQLDLPFAKFQKISVADFFENLQKLQHLQILNLPDIDLNKNAREKLLNYIRMSTNIEFIDLSFIGIYESDYGFLINDTFIKNVIEILKIQKRDKSLIIKVSEMSCSDSKNVMSSIKTNEFFKIDLTDSEYLLQFREIQQESNLNDLGDRNSEDSDMENYYDYDYYGAEFDFGDND